MNVNNSNPVSTQNTSAAKISEPSNELGKEAFLKILVTQMKNQDPLEPLKDTEFIGQMAQFSSLEQLTNLNTAMTQLIGIQGNQQQLLANHSNLLGNTVQWEQEVDGQITTKEGIVKAVALKNGEVMVELENEETNIPLELINRIEKRDQTN